MRLPSVSIQLALMAARDGASMVCLGSLCQCLTILQVHNFILISNLNIQFLSCLMILGLVQLLHTLAKSHRISKVGKDLQDHLLIYFEYQYIFSCKVYLCLSPRMIVFLTKLIKNSRKTTAHILKQAAFSRLLLL